MIEKAKVRAAVARLGSFYVALLKEDVVMLTVSYVNYDYSDEMA